MRIFETVGAIDVECFDGGVMITQDGQGDEDDMIFIPHALVAMVCKAIRETSKEGAEI